VLVVMGVSGCGKSTIAGVLNGRLGWELVEGDDLHPVENVAKMAAGHPLEDADREPWLRRIRARIDDAAAAGRPEIITCSALKRRYRDLLRDPHVVFVYLRGTRDEIVARVAARHGHFMPLALLDSQFATLEPPGDDEQSLAVDIGTSPTDQAADIIARLDLGPAR
jgi:carbohydrate kinase (thermoresistant glucokinase family)